MAMINISFDTKTKALSVAMDGKDLSNIAQVGIYKYYDDEAHIELTSVIGNEEEGLYERHCIYADYTKKDRVLMPKEYSELSAKLSKQLGHIDENIKVVG